jgi:hypothetical protein
VDGISEETVPTNARREASISDNRKATKAEIVGLLLVTALQVPALADGKQSKKTAATSFDAF